MAENRVTDDRDPVPGPGDSTLVPEGNSKARFFVPEEEEPEPSPSAAEGAARPSGSLGRRMRGLLGKLRRS